MSERPCRGCRYLVATYALCKWPETQGKWVTVTNPYTGQGRLRHFDADGKLSDPWRPTVEKERAEEGRCGPEARNYAPNLWQKIRAALTRDPDIMPWEKPAQ